MESVAKSLPSGSGKLKFSWYCWKNPLGQIIPTHCRDLLLKQFCLEDIVPAVLIILITHIIIAVRWMLIKILSVVINGQRSHKEIIPGGCYLSINIIRKIDRKIKMRSYSFCDPNSIFHTPTYPLLPKWQSARLVTVFSWRSAYSKTLKQPKVQ